MVLLLELLVLLLPHGWQWRRRRLCKHLLQLLLQLGSLLQHLQECSPLVWLPQRPRQHVM